MRDQPSDLYHRCSRSNLAKELTMRFANLLPVVDVGDVDTCANNVLHTSARSLQRGFDILENLDRLKVGVTNTNYLSISIGSSCASYMYSISHTNGPRIANDRFPVSACRDILTLHKIVYPLLPLPFLALVPCATFGPNGNGGLLYSFR